MLLTDWWYCSLAASLLPSGAAAVGFGGYVGSSRVESSVSAEAPTSFLVPCFCFMLSFLD